MQCMAFSSVLHLGLLVIAISRQNAYVHEQREFTIRAIPKKSTGG